jgi:hypothetical protein
MKAKSIKKYRVGGKNVKTVSNKKKGTSKKSISSDFVKHNLTVKPSDKSLEKKCEKTKCTKYVKEGLDFSEEFMTEAIKAGRKIMLEDPDLEKRKQAKRSVKAFLSAKKQMSGKKYLKEEMRICKKMYCNPTCAETIVNGIVEEGFNKKLDLKDVKKLKREGAISGCVYAW